MPPPPPPRRLDGGHTATHPSKIHTTECHIRGELVHESHWSRKQMLQLDVNAFPLSLFLYEREIVVFDSRKNLAMIININVLAWFGKFVEKELLAKINRVSWSDRLISYELVSLFDIHSIFFSIFLSSPRSQSRVIGIGEIYRVWTERNKAFFNKLFPCAKKSSRFHSGQVVGTL